MALRYHVRGAITRLTFATPFPHQPHRSRSRRSLRRAQTFQTPTRRLWRLFARPGKALNGKMPHFRDIRGLW